MRTFKFELKDKTEKVMDIDELTRWACLIEGLEKVTKKLEELNCNMDTDDWIKPLAFQKYIDERFHSMKHDITVEAMMGNI